MTPQENFDNFINEKKLSLKTKFVPFSLSRSAEEKQKSLNWKVTIVSPNGQFTCDYMKGIGHLPYPNTSFMKLNSYQSSSLNEAINSAVETGVARKISIVGKDLKVGIGNAEFPTPTMKEVLESLCLDSDVKNYLSFESWAKEFGYDTDSKKAEKIYTSCQKAAEGLAKVLGGVDNIDKVRDMIYDIENEPTPKKNKMK